MATKAKIEIKIKVDNRLFKITKWILFFTQPLWYLWRDKIWEWLSTGRPIPLIRYKLPYDKKWKWLRSSKWDTEMDSKQDYFKVGILQGETPKNTDQKKMDGNPESP